MKSKSQTVCAQSSHESEYQALAEAIKESIYLKILSNQIRQAQLAPMPNGQTICPTEEEALEPIEIFEDNEGAKKTAESEFPTKREKHFAVRLDFVKDEVQVQKTVKISSIDTKDQLADMGTKAQTEVLFVRCRDKTMRSLHPSILDKIEDETS